jgi:hypothetical protein
MKIMSKSLVPWLFKKNGPTMANVLVDTSFRLVIKGLRGENIMKGICNEL